MSALTLPRDHRRDHHDGDRGNRDRPVTDLDCNPQALILGRRNGLAFSPLLVGIALYVLLVGDGPVLCLLVVDIALYVLLLGDDLALYVFLVGDREKPG